MQHYHKSTTLRQKKILKVYISGGSRNFKTGGRSPSAVDFLESWDCFDAPQHIPFAFVVRVKNKIHIEHIPWLIQLKYMRVMQSKFTKTTPKIFSNGGRAPGAPILDPPLYIAVYSAE